MQDTLDLRVPQLALLHLTEDMDIVRPEIHQPSTRLVVVERQPPSLLDLPFELRDDILRYLLVSNTEVRPYSADSISVHPSILGTCKQIRDEGIGYLYKKNSFVLDEPINTMQFFSREFQGSRSLITNTTFDLGAALPLLDRRGHPSSSHTRQGWQDNYKNLRELALSILHWSMALENIPAGLSSVTVIQYDFLKHCLHIRLFDAAHTLYFCPGCAFTQFARDHPVEEFLPSALAGRIRFTQGPQGLISYIPDASPHVSDEEARLRRDELEEIVARRVAKIYNRP